MKCVQCDMPALTGSEHCWNHSDAVAPARARARSRGGKRARTALMVPVPSEPPRLRTVEDVQRECERLFGDALMLPNSPSRARALTGILLLALRTLETAEFAVRLEAVESRLALRRA